jgi:hypothetical protein
MQDFRHATPVCQPVRARGGISVISSSTFGGRGPIGRVSSPSRGGPLSDKGSPGEILVRKATSLNRECGTAVGLPNEQTSTRSHLGHQVGAGSRFTVRLIL